MGRTEKLISPLFAWDTSPKWIDREELGLGTRQCKRCIHSWNSLEAEYSLQRIITLHLWPLNKPRTIKLDCFCVLSMQYKSSLRALHTFLDFFEIHIFTTYFLTVSLPTSVKVSVRKGKKIWFTKPQHGSLIWESVGLLSGRSRVQIPAWPNLVPRTLFPGFEGAPPPKPGKSALWTRLSRANTESL